mmetsp:Transcript_34898/g.64603  ORF Transcript_34898/g.64603 Transcript_34898/m.64603 type:complete len:153 (-) Transcript_34898:377-835(-)
MIGDLTLTSKLEEESSLTKASQKLLKDVVSSGLKDEEVKKVLEKTGCDEKTQGAFTTVLEGRRRDIKHHLEQNVSAIFPSYLKDFDWSLKTVVASDRLAEISEPVVVLTLCLKNTDGSENLKRVELNKTSLEKLLSTCSSANKVVRQLTHDS